MSSGPRRGAHLLIAGMHRSGTTQTGRILARCPGVQVIHEPLNREYGLAGVRHVYPCDLEAAHGRAYLELLDGLLDGNAGCVRRVAGDPPLKALARAAVGGRTGLDVAQFRLRRLLSPSLLPVLKDPFASLLSRSIVDAGGRVLALVRHPAAVWLSVSRMGWRFRYANFACEGIFAALGLPVDMAALDARAEVEKFAWLWTAIYTYLERLVGHERFLLLRHEDLCVQPYVELQRIGAFFGLTPDRAAREFIARTMFAGTVSAAGRQLHVPERNAGALPAAWQGRIATEEAAVIETICGPLVESCYGRWQSA